MSNLLHRWAMRLDNWLAPKDSSVATLPEPESMQVLLFSRDNHVKKSPVERSQGGVWLARWHSSGDLLVLSPGGTIDNGGVIVRWLPHSGWSEEELRRCRIAAVAPEGDGEGQEVASLAPEGLAPTFGIDES